MNDCDPFIDLGAEIDAQPAAPIQRVADTLAPDVQRLIDRASSTFDAMPAPELARLMGAGFRIAHALNDQDQHHGRLASSLSRHAAMVGLLAAFTRTNKERHS